MTAEPEQAQSQISDGLPARQVAYTVLNDILFHRKSLDEAYARAVDFEKLPSRDRGFVRLLVSIVLKRSAQMDAALQNFLHEPLADLKPPQMLNIFRLGIAQYAFIETPPHAAVNTTVALAEVRLLRESPEPSSNRTSSASSLFVFRNSRSASTPHASELRHAGTSPGRVASPT